MNDRCEWRKSAEADRLDAIGRLLRARFDQIAKAPAPQALIDLADRLEAKAAQSADAGDEDGAAAGRSPPKASDA
jgi:hypothetical protein